MQLTDKPKILYIDDELQNLNTFRANFRFDYDILLAINTTDAMRHLSENDTIRIILCDHRMPDKTGVEFFEDIKTLYSHPVRILVTGITDIEAVIASINRGQIFRYITKPWNEVDLKSAIEEALKYYEATSLLRQRNEQLTKAYDELDKFTSSVSHDMRGPIMSVLGVIGIAKKTSDLSELQEIIEMIEKSMQKLRHFIDNTHDYYRLKQGENIITEIKFEKLIAQINDIYDLHGKVNLTSFKHSITQEGSFKTDEIALKIVINNLLSNAFKYQKKNTTDKYVELTITANSQMAEITVKDNGIGIEEAYVSKIFDLFYRATSEQYGSGFGLYNVKDALKKLRGDIKVYSVLHEGSTFIVKIPSL